MILQKLNFRELEDTFQKDSNSISYWATLNKMASKKGGAYGTRKKKDS
jgi:hypothetical protein